MYSADCLSYVKALQRTCKVRCNCRISSTRILIPKRFGSASRSVAVFFGRMFDQWSTRVVRGRGRLADLFNKASFGVRWARCSANISVLIRIEADHFAQRDFHFTTGGVSTEIPTPSPQRSPWFISKRGGAFSLCARHSENGRFSNRILPFWRMVVISMYNSIVSFLMTQSEG